MGDSKLIIKWVQGYYNIFYLTCKPLLERIQNVAFIFEVISFKHFYHQFNSKIVILSKEAIIGPTNDDPESRVYPRGY